MAEPVKEGEFADEQDLVLTEEHAPIAFVDRELRRIREAPSRLTDLQMELSAATAAKWPPLAVAAPQPGDRMILGPMRMLRLELQAIRVSVFR